MFKRSDLKAAVRNLKYYMENLPVVLGNAAKSGKFAVNIGDISDFNHDNIVCAFDKLQENGKMKNETYDSDRGIFFTDRKVAERANEVDEFLYQNRFSLDEVPFPVKNLELDRSLLHFRDFKLVEGDNCWYVDTQEEEYI